MDQFYMIVLGAIAVLLILMLTGVGLLMYSAKAKPEAPLRSTCPDYWTFDGSGCLVGTVNVGGLTDTTKIKDDATKYSAARSNDKIYYGASPSTTPQTYYINPTSTMWGNNTLYKGKTEVCAKNKWATDLGIVWDGYTNTTEC